MIQHGERVRALVVAIDRYDDDRIPMLASPVPDALAVLRWLGAAGVPWGQVTLHVATSSPYQAVLDREAELLGTRFVRPTDAEQGERGGVRLLDARLDTIEQSVVDLVAFDPSRPVDLSPASEPQDRILIFLLGHGFQLPKRGNLGSRIFLTQDYRPAATRNVAVEHLAENCQYVPDLRQAVIVFDACSTQPFAGDERERVVPGTLQYLQIGDLNPAAGVAICSSSGQLEQALEVPQGAGPPRSVFLSALLRRVSPEGIRDEFIDFDGSTRAVLDLRAVMLDEHVGVRQEVQRVTGHQQNPELIPKGANTGEGVIPLFVLDQVIEPRRFLKLKAMRMASSRNWIEAALEYHRRVTQARELLDAAHQFRDAVGAVAEIPVGEGARAPLAESLAVVERDLRSAAAALQSEEWDPSDGTDDLQRRGRRAFERAGESADLAAAPADGGAAGVERNLPDAMRPMMTAAERYVEGTETFRMLVEAVYAKAVWEALGDVAPGGERLLRDEAVRLLGWWVALADAPRLSRRAEGVAARAGSHDGSLGLTLLQHHAHLEHVQSWMRQPVPDHLPPTARDLIDRLEAFRAELAGALLDDSAGTLQEKVRRLGQDSPEVAKVLGRTILDELGRQAMTSGRRAVG